MAIKTILFLVSFVAACGGALYMPLVGIVGYLLHYHLWPEKQWWGQSLEGLGIRYSFLIALCTMLGVIFNFHRLRYGIKFLTTPEALSILFLVLIWVAMLFNPPLPRPLGDDSEPPAIKLTKVLIFVLILTHVATTVRRLDVVLWTFVVGSAFLGMQALISSRTMIGGRLDDIGGPDFHEANGLAGYLAACLPIIAVQFMRSGWKGKVLAALAGVLTINAIVLTRSRGAFVGLAAGMMLAVLIAPKGKRKVALAGLVMLCVGACALMDKGFWERINTIRSDAAKNSPAEVDDAAQIRIAVWKGSAELLSEHPLGVGPGNFPILIGHYARGHTSRDAHSSYVLCYSELGVQGLFLYLVLAASSFAMLAKAQSQCRQLPAPQQAKCTWLGYGMAISLITLLVSGTTTSRLYAEASWWFLLLPVCLWRAMVNLREDTKPLPLAKPQRSAPPWQRRARASRKPAEAV